MTEILQLDHLSRIRFLLFGKLESFSIYNNNNSNFAAFSDENLVEKFVK
jgi:hypothetical protein